MIMFSQRVHAMLVYYNLKMCFPQLKETFSLVIDACDNEDRFPKVPRKLRYKLTIFGKMSGLNSERFLSDKFYDSIVLLGRPIGCFRFQWRKSVLFFIKRSTKLSRGRILSTVISHSSLSGSIKDTVPCFCSSVSNCK